MVIDGKPITVLMSGIDFFLKGSVWINFAISGLFSHRQAFGYFGLVSTYHLGWKIKENLAPPQAIKIYLQESSAYASNYVPPCGYVDAVLNSLMKRKDCVSLKPCSYSLREYLPLYWSMLCQH